MTTSVSETAKSSESASETRRRRIGLVFIGVFVAVAAGGFGVITGHTGTTPGIMSQTVTYDVTDTSVTVNWSVAKSEDEEVRCVVDAFDTNFEVMSSKEIVVPVGTSSLKGTETLPTPRRATGGRIHNCREA